MVYFHNPKFVRQPQLPTIKEIAQSATNTLPLITQLFPTIKVFFDDDPTIPSLTGPITSSQPQSAVPATIQEFVRPMYGIPVEKPPDQTSYAWLVCCSSVFLLDTEKQQIWASPDQSLLPLLAFLLRSFSIEDEDATVVREVDMSTAHGHVSFPVP